MKMVAVLALQRSGRAPFSAEDLGELREQVEPYAAGLEMVRVARRSLGTHLRNSAGAFTRRLIRRGSWGRKALVAGIAALGFWSVNGALPYSITAPCALVPMEGRHVATAVDGVLLRTNFIPGDRVRAGEVLCEFDKTSLELEAARLRSELAVNEVEIYRALDKSLADEAGMARASSEAIQANLDFVTHKLQNLSVLAPVDGVILEGDLRDRIGDVFSKGETLFRIASFDKWKLEIRVPERDVAMVHAETAGTFASHSRPGEAHELEVLRLSPAAENVDGANFFIAEARCDVPDTWVRSGMEGFASLDVGERSPAWIAGHRLLNFMRMHFWL